MFTKLKHKLAIWSIRKALKEQNLMPIYEELEEILPDIRDQYSFAEVNSEYKITNIRAMHAFQMDFLSKAIERVGERAIVVSMVSEDVSGALKGIDIGDSSGNHTLYLKGLFPATRFKMLSVNADENAVNKIAAKGLNAILCSLEDLVMFEKYEPYDFGMMFEVLEHIENPVDVLRKLKKMCIDKFIITVPYLRKSRVGLHQIRQGSGGYNLENTHIFELCPEDWKLLFAYTGWEVVREAVYLQYPRWCLPLRYLWRKKDFEGFWGCVLGRKDET